jgi:hypothetical protein
METSNVKTLGQTIGKVSKACKVTNTKGDAVTIVVIIDFSTSSDSDIRAWLASDRIIAGQRPWRALSADEIKELDGQTFNANSIGTKVKSRSEQLNDLMTVFTNAGVDATQALALANAALDNPSSLTIA